MLQASTLTFIPQVYVDTWTYINNTNAIFYLLQAVCCLYFLTCVFWWIYIIRKIYLYFKRRVVIVRSSKYSANQEGVEDELARVDDCIVRNVKYLICAVFALMFSLLVNIYGVYVIITTIYLPPISVPISRNCSLVPNSFLAEYYDFRISSLILNLLFCMKNFSFSMMLWLFTASLLHSSFAAGNKLRIYIISRFVLIAILINGFTAALAFIPYTILFGKILQNLIDSYCVYIAFYIAKKKFSLGMNGGFADKYPYCSDEDDQALKQRKTIVFLIITSLGVYIHSNLFVFMPYAILNSISLNSCWFHVTHRIPMFELSGSVVNTLLTISNYMLLFYRVIEVFVFVCFTLINLVYICKICLHAFKKTFCQRQTYPLQELSRSLLSLSNSLI